MYAIFLKMSLIYFWGKDVTVILEQSTVKSHSLDFFSKPTGNRDLLRCNELWADLLAHYQAEGCVVDPAKNIKVLQRPNQHQR